MHASALHVPKRATEKPLTQDSVDFVNGYVSLIDVNGPEDLLKGAFYACAVYDREVLLRMARGCLQEYLHKWEHRRDHVCGDVYDPLEPVM